MSEPAEKPWLNTNGQRGKTYEERFHEKYLLDPQTGCWNWQAAVLGGYGVFGQRRAHRVAYELLRETIPEGMVLDHLCLNKRCVNPFHLEVVTQHENRVRQSERVNQRTHCKNGHEMIDGNIVVMLRCRQCMQDAWARYEAKKGKKK